MGDPMTDESDSHTRQSDDHTAPADNTPVTGLPAETLFHSSAWREAVEQTFDLEDRTV